MREHEKPIPAGIICPKCHCADTHVHTTRHYSGHTRRYRTCRHCGKKFSSVEQVSGTAKPKPSY